MRCLRFLLLMLGFVLCALPGCKADDTERDPSEEELTQKLSVNVVRTEQTYKSLAVEGGGFGQAGRTMKFFIDARAPSQKKIYFINGNYKEQGQVPDFAKFHYFFARRELAIPDPPQVFNDATYFTDN